MPAFGPGTGAFSIGASQNSFLDNADYNDADFDESTAATQAALLDVLRDASEAAAEISRHILSEDVSPVAPLSIMEGPRSRVAAARPRPDRRWTCGNHGSNIGHLSEHAVDHSRELQPGFVAMPLVGELLRMIPTLPSFDGIPYIPGISPPLETLISGDRTPELPRAPPSVHARRASAPPAASIAAREADDDPEFWDRHFAGLPSLLAVGAA